jgi:hypothetical protein
MFSVAYDLTVCMNYVHLTFEFNLKSILVDTCDPFLMSHSNYAFIQTHSSIIVRRMCNNLMNHIHLVHIHWPYSSVDVVWTCCLQQQLWHCDTISTFKVVSHWTHSWRKYKCAPLFSSVFCLVYMPTETWSPECFVSNVTCSLSWQQCVWVLSVCSWSRAIS